MKIGVRKNEESKRKLSARQEIVSLLLSSRKPMSVPEILAILKEGGKEYNKTTLYREIENLKHTDAVKELFFRNDMALYELSGEHHHHLVCVACGDVREVKIEESLAVEEEKLAKREQFVILDHSLEFFGKCKQCQ